MSHARATCPSGLIQTLRYWSSFGTEPGGAKPYYQTEGITLYHGDSREILAQLQAESFDLCSDGPALPRAPLGAGNAPAGLLNPPELHAPASALLRIGNGNSRTCTSS